MVDRSSVRRTYDHIAEHFAETRAHPWPDVREFLNGRTGAVGLDVGCGNGRHAALLADRTDQVLGLDVSRALLMLAADRVLEASWIQGDASALPLCDDCVDVGVYVATIHHLPTQRLRVQSLNELARVLSPDGQALVSAWSTTHDRFDQIEGFDAELDWTLPDGEVVGRFYHVYDPAEFDADLDSSDLSVVRTFTSSGNCYAVVGAGKGNAHRRRPDR